MNLPEVYIVILNWNGLEDTIECLESIARLTYPSVTPIVVDNGSRNNQADVIAQKFPDAVVLKQAENIGFCGGCNVGIKYAMQNGADYVMLLNNDTLVPPDLIDKLVAGIEGLHNVAAVSPIILEHPDTEKVWFSRARWEAAEAQFRLAYVGEKYEDMAKLEPYKSEFVCGCCMLVSTETFRREGMLDERYFAFYDEAEWCSRVRRNGLESYVIPSAFMYHKVSRSTPSLVSTYLLARNRLLWIKENRPFRKRIRSYIYIAKELAWHASNVAGLRSGGYTDLHSRAMLRGFRDYIFGRFYKWDAKTERLIFNEKR